MKKTTILLIWLYLFIIRFCAIGQLNNCGNIGFEQGSFMGWQLSNGVVIDSSFQTLFRKEIAGSYKDGHFLTNTSMGNDPLVKIDQLPMVAPGSNYSIRIGNDATGARFDRIKTSFLVTKDNTLFQYKFAIVLEDPNHKNYQQPAFRIRVFSSKNSESIPCGYYEVSAARGISGFKEQPSARNQKALTFRNWTTGAIDLSNFLGEIITVEVTSNDCTESGHFGYCYFDAQCLKSEIIASSFCPMVDSVATIFAPDGYEKYTWSTGENTQSIKVKPEMGKVVSVKVKPYSSLNEDCELLMNYNLTTLIQPGIQNVTICEGEGFSAEDTTYRANSTFLTRIKRNGLCDSLVTINLTVKPLPRFTQNVTVCEGESFFVGTASYATTGTFLERIKRNGLCDSLVTTNLTVKPLPRFTQNVTVCEGESFFVGTASYTTTGTFLERIKRNGLCDSLVTTNLTVKPLPRFTQNVTVCEGESFPVGDTLYKVNGTHTTRIKRKNLCDSLVTTNLTIIPLPRFTQDITICQGDSFAVGDTSYKSNGTFLRRIKRNGLCDSLVTTNLTVIKIVISISGNASIDMGDSLLLAPNVQPSGSYNYHWSPSQGLSCPSCSSTWVKILESKNYTFTVEDLVYGCKEQSKVSVTVKPCLIYLPDVFSPDSDGINELFYPIADKCVKTILQFSIYNRWGSLIFSQSNFAPSTPAFGWNGKYADEDVQLGTFPYTIKAEFLNGEIYEKRGEVMILK